MAGEKFLVGVNNAWFDGAYGNDLWDSQYSGRTLWHWPHTDPIPWVAVAGGRGYPSLTMPANPIGPAKVSLDDMKARLATYRGLDVVRIWLHDQFEGLIFDNQQRVASISIAFPDRLKLLLDAAQSNGLKLYLCLFTAWDSVADKPPQGLPADRVELWRLWVKVKQKLMLNILQNPDHYWSFALQPLLAKIKGHPALYAIDIMNEPEGLNDSRGLNLSPWDNKLKYFVKWTARYIHTQTGNCKVSVGALRRDLAMKMSRETEIDFADFHEYNASSVLQQYYKEDFAGKPCILGEVGYPGDLPEKSRAIYEEPVNLRFVQQAHLKGYSGVLCWGLKDFQVGSEPAEFLGKLKNIAKGNLVVRAPPVNHWAIFLSYFGIK